MAEILIHKRTGEIAWVAPDGHAWGLNESIDAWTAAGHDPAAFPTDLQVIKRPGDSVDAWRAKKGERYQP